jgi:S-DNA-T family DNA segregation ATPase FtsK/SpoIIIE
VTLLRQRVGRERRIFRFRWPLIRLPWWLFIAYGVAFLAWQAISAAVWLLLHPRTLAVVAVAWLAWVSPVEDVAAVVAAVAGKGAAWRWFHRRSFDRIIAWPATARFRRLWVYRRRWQPAMVTTGLALSSSQGGDLPELERVVHRPGLDRVTVRLLPGQDLPDWTRVGDRLARVFGVADVRPRSVPNRTDALELWCQIRDPLDRAVPVLEPATDLEAVPVAVTEAGDPFTVPVSTRTGSHLLIAGETGSGKGSVLWSLLSSLEPHITAGTVRVWGIDPKGGMELQAGAHLFSKFAYRDVEDMAGMLEAAVAALRQRTEDLRRQGVRRLEPTRERPLIVILIDELAALVAYVTDATMRRRITDALALLLSQGRAPGLMVVAATQDARKETLGLRDLFPRRIALRTAEAGMADMILGEGARARGARTEQIPAHLPGVAYVHADGHPEPARVRFPYLSDAEISALGRHALEDVPVP